MNKVILKRCYNSVTYLLGLPFLDPLYFDWKKRCLCSVREENCFLWRASHMMCTCMIMTCGCNLVVDRLQRKGHAAWTRIRV